MEDVGSINENRFDYPSQSFTFEWRPAAFALDVFSLYCKFLVFIKDHKVCCITLGNLSGVQIVDFRCLFREYACDAGQRDVFLCGNCNKYRQALLNSWQP